MRNLDPAEVDYLAASGIDDSLDRALDGAEAVYVALDMDVLAPSEAVSFMPEPAGPTSSDLETLLEDLVTRVELAGIGVTGLVPSSGNVGVVTRLLSASGI